MSNYEGLSKIYDFMMSGVDYEAWADYVLSAAKRFGCEPRTILDLACGTGSTTLPLAARGAKVTGLDLAPAMLKIAEEKAAEAGLSVDFTEKNMLELDYDHEFDMVVSFQDGINYLTGDGDFEKLASGVERSLKDQGVFLFDLNRVDHYSDSDTTVVDLEDMYLVYENNYSAENRIWHIKLTGFVKEGELYRKFEEIHEEKNHDFREVKKALEAHRMSVVAVWKMFYEEDAGDEVNRVLVVAKKG